MCSWIRRHLNFYRLHLLLFILVPLFSSLILWACNGKFPIKFIDALYICISGATGTGLSPVDLSSLTPFQRAILALLELVGNQAFVAWVVVVVRRSFFRRHLEHIVAAELERTTTRHDTIISQEITPAIRSITKKILQNKKPTRTKESVHGEVVRVKSAGRSASNKLRPDMVRRVDLAPHPIDPIGRFAVSQDVQPSSPTSQHAYASGISSTQARQRVSSMARANPINDHPVHGHEESFGGFPYPQDLISRAFRKAFPAFHRRMRRTVTIPRNETLVPSTSQKPVNGASKRVPYISFSAVVGRNSVFKGLTSENIEELGGVEYRALSTLLWIVPVYYIGILLISFIVIAPYMSLPRWRDIFQPPQQHRVISPIWFSAFQVIGAWANTGMSLVDQNMVPFQTAYVMIVFLVLCVLAGNTCLPIFLRFMIWIFTKILPSQSRTKESMHFLLDHPRRCFIYLFPAHQTWLLLGTVLILNGVDYVFYLVLDINNATLDAIPVGRRFILALLSAASVRSAGFQAVPISALVPAVQVLYVVMMYIAIYPIALSVRSTNVYEERSLGVYDDTSSDDLEENPPWKAQESRVTIWGKYLGRHARAQLSFDMWWLALSLFLLCIIERDNLTNPENMSWFNIFALLFELVSAYGTVGLSLGVPYANYSFSGALHTLSKLILITVMLRGRHRGLPVALDRAVMLPHELELPPEKQAKNQDPAKSVDSEKLEAHDTGSMHKGDEDVEGGLRTPAATSLAGVEESPRPGGSGAHVMWPTGDVSGVQEV